MTNVVERLRAMRSELRADLGTGVAVLARDVDDRGEDTTASQHPADVASDLYAREEIVADVVALERDLADIDDALERLARGTYGVCIECGHAISAERLDARPQAARCIDCQRRLARTRR